MNFDEWSNETFALASEFDAYPLNIRDFWTETEENEIFETSQLRLLTVKGTELNDESIVVPSDNFKFEIWRLFPVEQRLFLRILWSFPHLRILMSNQAEFLDLCLY